MKIEASGFECSFVNVHIVLSYLFWKKEGKIIFTEFRHAFLLDSKMMFVASLFLTPDFFLSFSLSHTHTNAWISRHSLFYADVRDTAVVPYTRIIVIIIYTTSDVAGIQVPFGHCFSR